MNLGDIDIKKLLFQHRRIHETTGCWLWTDRLQADGYGVISLPTEDGTRRKDYLVHRLSYIEYKGQPTKFVLHIVPCFFKNCFNPEHLYDGDHKANAEDRRIFGYKNQHGLLVGRTHCINGHEIKEENLTDPKSATSRRQCRLCMRDRSTRRRQRLANQK